MTETHTPLPCPFCNGQANTEIRHSRIDGVKDRHFPSCLNGDCPAFIVEPYVTYSTKREALTAWNTRAVNSHHRLVEALRKAREALCNHACHAGEAAPCIRTPDQCAFDCGLAAGDAIQTIDAELKEAGRG